MYTRISHRSIFLSQFVSYVISQTDLASNALLHFAHHTSSHAAATSLRMRTLFLKTQHGPAFPQPAQGILPQTTKSERVVTQVRGFTGCVPSPIQPTPTAMNCRRHALTCVMHPSPHTLTHTHTHQH